MIFFWVFVGLFVLGMIWASAPLWQNRDACPYGCRIVSHDGGPYMMPATYEINNPACPDHGGAS